MKAVRLSALWCGADGAIQVTLPGSVQESGTDGCRDANEFFLAPQTAAALSRQLVAAA